MEDKMHKRQEYLAQIYLIIAALIFTLCATLYYGYHQNKTNPSKYSAHTTPGPIIPEEPRLEPVIDRMLKETGKEVKNGS